MSLMDLGKRLLQASRVGDVEEVKILMTNGAPFTTDWLGTSPLHYAANQGHIPTAEVLLRAGISRDARTKVDRTPLHIACQEGHLDVVELLLKHGADIETKDMLKMTPLHWAVERGHIAVVQTLLKNGARQSLDDKFDRTPIQIAINNQSMDLLDMLQVAQQANLDDLETGHELEIQSTEHATDVITDSEHMISGTVTVSTTPSKKTESEEDSDQHSTSVLATLAALAEATAPLSTSAASNPSSSEALNWLETHGITMISASALESGSTLALTEAGKLALNLVKTQGSGAEATDSKSTDDQKVIAIVAGEDSGVSLPLENSSQDTDEPAVKRIKLENAPPDVVKFLQSGSTDLKQQLAAIQRQADDYKEQLRRKEEEAEGYKKKLEEITQTKETFE